MTTPKAGVRSRRRNRPAPVVAVTRAAGPVGAAVAEVLQRSATDGAGVAAVHALDLARGVVDGPLWRIGPLDEPDVLARLGDADVVVHVAVETDLAAALQLPARERRTAAVRAAQAVTTSAAAAGVRHLIVVSSAMLLGARPENDLPLPDDAPVRAEADDGIVGDLGEVEEVLRAAGRAHPRMRITVLRAAALVGPGVDTIVTRHFEAPRLLTLRGHEMLWQFCHVDDLASAVLMLVREDVEGVPIGPGDLRCLTVGSGGPMTAAQVEERTGMRRVEVPASMAFATAERLHRIGVLPAPAGDIAYVVHPWVVSAEALRAAGWTPSRTTADCLDVLMEQVRGRHAVVGRRIGPRDAAMGAAGAAVAVIGTAALLRRARGRR